MIDSIEKALRPVFLITFFLGLRILKYPSDQLKYRLSFIYIFTMWSVHAYVSYYTLNLFSMKDTLNTMNVFVIVVNLFVALTTIVTSIYKHEKYRESMQNFNHVDDTIENLGISNDYPRTRNFIRLTLIIWISTTSMSWIVNSSIFIAMYGDIRAILIPHVLNYVIYVNTITDTTFMLLLRHIGIRLDKINDYIAQISEIEDYGLRYKWKKFLIVKNHCVRGAKNHKLALWIAIHLHLKLCQTARDINSYFGTQMTLQMISYFIILIEMFHFQYYMILNWKQIYQNNIRVIISIYGWCIFYLIKLILLNCMCENVSNKAQKTKDVIHKLTNFISFADIREEIYQFVLQISLRPLKFSGLGLFYFGYDFIHKFFVWIITAVIFMVQMGVTPITKDVLV